MAGPPLFQSGKTQRLMVALLMVGVFGVSLSLAWGVSAVRGVPASMTAETGETIGGAEGIGVTLPGDWQQQAIDADQPASLFVDTGRPQRRMLVQSLGQGDRPLLRVVPDVLRGLLSPSQQQGYTPVLDRPLAVRPQPGVRAVLTAGVSPVDEQRVTYHLLAVLADDQNRFWAIYLTDRGPRGEAFQVQAMQNLRLISAVLQSVEFSQKD
ncbi:MAG: hypothetical protein ACOCTI_05885 [Phycisphaeraceae bacterium]